MGTRKFWPKRMLRGRAATAAMDFGAGSSRRLPAATSPLQRQLPCQHLSLATSAAMSASQDMGLARAMTATVSATTPSGMWPLHTTMDVMLGADSDDQSQTNDKP